MNLNLKSILPSSGDGQGAPEPTLAEGSDDTPPEIQEGRAEFAHAFGDLAKGKRNWQLVAFGALALLAFLVVAYVKLSASSRIQTHIVEVDRLGRARLVGEAQTEPGNAAIRTQVRLFLRNVRAVYSDPVAQREMVNRAYAVSGGEARDFLEGYFSDPENDPRLLSDDFSRTVQVQSLLRVPGGGSSSEGTPSSITYRAQWTETMTRQNGRRTEEAWEGYLTVEVHPPQTPQQAQVNPLGVTITALEWSRVSDSDS